MGTPEIIYCDEGSEFTNHKFKELMKDNNIQIIYTLTHAPVVERFNRTLKMMLEKYMQVSKSKTIINVLPKIIKNYN
jgi:transposase InsO family protein